MQLVLVLENARTEALLLVDETPETPLGSLRSKPEVIAAVGTPLFSFGIAASPSDGKTPFVPVSDSMRLESIVARCVVIAPPPPPHHAPVFNPVSHRPSHCPFNDFQLCLTSFFFMPPIPFLSSPHVHCRLPVHAQVQLPMLLVKVSASKPAVAMEGGSGGISQGSLQSIGGNQHQIINYGVMVSPSPCAVTPSSSAIPDSSCESDPEISPPLKKRSLNYRSGLGGVVESAGDRDSHTDQFTSASKSLAISGRDCVPRALQSSLSFAVAGPLQCKARFLQMAAAGFTQLSPTNSDYHQNYCDCANGFVEAYLTAKFRCFGNTSVERNLLWNSANQVAGKNSKDVLHPLEEGAVAGALDILREFVSTVKDKSEWEHSVSTIMKALRNGNIGSPASQECFAALNQLDCQARVMVNAEMNRRVDRPTTLNSIDLSAACWNAPDESMQSIVSSTTESGAPLATLDFASEEMPSSSSSSLTSFSPISSFTSSSSSSSTSLSSSSPGSAFTSAPTHSCSSASSSSGLADTSILSVYSSSSLHSDSFLPATLPSHGYEDSTIPCDSKLAASQTLLDLTSPSTHEKTSSSAVVARRSLPQQFRRHPMVAVPLLCADGVNRWFLASLRSSTSFNERVQVALITEGMPRAESQFKSVSGLSSTEWECELEKLRLWNAVGDIRVGTIVLAQQLSGERGRQDAAFLAELAMGEITALPVARNGNIKVAITADDGSRSVHSYPRSRCCFFRAPGAESPGV